ncbi:hypothetical protein ACNAN0_02495 [Agrilactobacillus fermenti]|uniref:hypothetical protein n=1 Tax=Agrilactobacillus fermenti TaxID=2586909 RepID=UPI001E62C9FE|nr:hypothetical protein [Agrilactobacillus fermenti]MCD2256414.1 hypothetical protein [Agrilactobacillus fermenti]
MRYDHIIKFYLANDNYDPDATEDTQGQAVLVAESIANVTDLGTTRAVELLGSLNEQALVIRSPDKVALSSNWSYIQIDDGETHYVKQTTRFLLKEGTLIVGEANG